MCHNPAIYICRSSQLITAMPVIKCLCVRVVTHSLVPRQDAVHAEAVQTGVLLVAVVIGNLQLHHGVGLDAGVLREEMLQWLYY